MNPLVRYNHKQRRRWRQARALAQLVSEGVLELDGRGRVEVGAEGLEIVRALNAAGWNADGMIAAEMKVLESAAVALASETAVATERMRDAALERGCVVCSGEVGMERFGKWITGHSGPFCSDECKSRFYRLGLHEK